MKSTRLVERATEVQIVFRHRPEPGTEKAFVVAWERCKAEMLGRARGALAASLYQNAADPLEFVTVTRWRSIKDWQRYWGDGIPDPEGELRKNEILVEVRALQAAANTTVSDRGRRQLRGRTSRSKGRRAEGGD